MKIIYVLICILALLLFVLGSFKIEYLNPGITPTPTPARVTPTPIPKPTGKTPRPIVVGQAEKDLINKLTQDNVVALDKITTKIAPQDFLELSAMLEFITKPNTVWTWTGPAIASIPTTTDIINDLNNLKATTLENVTEVRGISQVELARLALLGKIVYLNGKWGWNYKTIPTQLVTDLNNSNIKSANDVINIKTIVSNETIKDMMNSRYLLFVDGKWIWNSVMDPKDYNKQPKIWENGAIVAIGIILFLILLVVGIRLLSKD